MTCDQLRDSFELYVLGLLEDPVELAEIGAHLERGCPTCVAAMKDALAVQALLLGQAPEVLPPVRLRRRVLGAVGIQPLGWTWFAAICAAAMLVTALWYGVVSSFRRSERDDARAQVAESMVERQRLQAAFRFLEDPKTRQVSFGDEQKARGNVYASEQLGVLLVVSNLPAVPAGSTFEMWLVPKHGAPRPAGLFRADPDGSAVHILGQRLDLADIAAIAVSVEPVSGAPVPTSPVLFTAPIG